MTDDPWINFFVILTVGANLATLTLWGLALAARFGRGDDAWAQTRDVARVTTASRSRRSSPRTAMVGSLYLSEGAHLPPCRLCWYQRIAMYSLAVILVVAVVRRDWNVRPYALTLGAHRSVHLDLPLPDRALPELGARHVVRSGESRAPSRGSGACTTSRSR